LGTDQIFANLILGRRKKINRGTAATRLNAPSFWGGNGKKSQLIGPARNDVFRLPGSRSSCWRQQKTKKSIENSQKDHISQLPEEAQLDGPVMMKSKVAVSQPG